MRNKHVFKSKKSMKKQKKAKKRISIIKRKTINKVLDFLYFLWI